MGCAPSLASIAKNSELSIEEAKLAVAVAFASLPAYVMGCVLTLAKVLPADLKRIEPLSDRDGRDALDARAKTFVSQLAPTRLLEAGLFIVGNCKILTVVRIAYRAGIQYRLEV